MASYARLESRRRDFHRSLRKLPDREDDTENKDRSQYFMRGSTVSRPDLPSTFRGPFVYTGIVGLDSLDNVAFKAPQHYKTLM
jgi:hypothetical protein